MTTLAFQDKEPIVYCPLCKVQLLLPKNKAGKPVRLDSRDYALERHCAVFKNLLRITRKKLRQQRQEIISKVYNELDVLGDEF